VVAGDDIDAIGRVQVAQGFDVVSTVLECPVDQVSRDDDEVDAQMVLVVHHGTGPGLFEQTADVQVVELQKLIALERNWQVGHSQLDVLDGRHTDGLADTERGREIVR
jgi:hypothetical protein